MEWLNLPLPSFGHTVERDGWQLLISLLCVLHHVCRLFASSLFSSSIFSLFILYSSVHTHPHHKKDPRFHLLFFLKKKMVQWRNSHGSNGRYSVPKRQHPLWIVLFFSYFDTFSTILNRILHLQVYTAFFYTPRLRQKLILSYCGILPLPYISL